MNPTSSAPRRGRRIAVAVLVVAAAAAAWLATAYLVKAPVAPLRATVLPEGMPLPDFSLLDQRGNAIDRQALLGRWHLAFFGFTHCPDVCPVTLGQLAMARRRLADEHPGTTPPDVLFISVDPERDTVERIGQYLAPFGDGVTGLTGNPGELAGLARTLGIYYAKSESAGDADYSVDHTAAILLINPQAELKAIFGTPHDVAAIVHDIDLLTGEGS